MDLFSLCAAVNFDVIYKHFFHTWLVNEGYFNLIKFIIYYMTYKLNTSVSIHTFYYEIEITNHVCVISRDMQRNSIRPITSLLCDVTIS